MLSSTEPLLEAEVRLRRQKNDEETWNCIIYTRKRKESSVTISSTFLAKRSISLRMTGIMVLVLALLFTITSYTLQTQLNFPVIFLDKASFAQSLLARGEIATLLSFLGLLLCGVLLVAVSSGLAPHLEGKRRMRVIATGGAAGMWIVGALLGLVLVSLWGSAQVNAARAAATFMLVLLEVVAPLLLALWTVTLAGQFRAHRVLGWVGASGLVLICLRSLVWLLNALLPLKSGFYATAGILNLLALLGESFWLFWLLLFGLRLLAQRERHVAPMPQTGSTQQDEEPMQRRRFLKVGMSLGIGLTLLAPSSKAQLLWGRAQG